MSIDISVIWFVIIVFATLMYIVMDGFDLGIGILFPAIQDADDRDVMVNSVAPVWDGNETWLVLGEVVGIHIDETLLEGGIYQTAKAKPVLRAGGPTAYYSISETHRFDLVRPDARAKR